LAGKKPKKKKKKRKMLKLRTVLALLAMAFCASCQLQNGIVVTGQTSSAGGVSFAYYNFTSSKNEKI
jgi:hypothetical protein